MKTKKKVLPEEKRLHLHLGGKIIRRKEKNKTWRRVSNFMTRRKKEIKLRWPGVKVVPLKAHLKELLVIVMIIILGSSFK